MENMKYSKMNKKSSEVCVSSPQAIEEIISEDHRLYAGKPEALRIFLQGQQYLDNDGIRDHDADTISLGDTETSSVLLEDMEITNSQIKELRFQTESFLDETVKLMASSNSIYSVCKEYHAKLSCLTSEQQSILTEEETTSEPFKNTCSDKESLNMELETLKSMLKEKNQLITEIRSHIERLFQLNQDMEKLEINLYEKKQTTIEKSNSDLDNNSLNNKSLDTKIFLIKNEEIQNPLTEKLTKSKIETAELKEEMKQLERLKKSHWEPVDELKIKEEDKLNRKRTNSENEPSLEAKENKKKTRENILSTDDQLSKNWLNHGRINRPANVSTADSRLRRSSRQKKPQIQ